MLDPSFWQDRRVFVTGHTGFKGTWLSLWLAQMGAEVTGFSLAEPPSEPHLFGAAQVASVLAAHRTGDVRDAGRVREALDAAAPEIVFHLAAQALVRPGYAEPVATFATNVMGTAHVLEAARHAPSVRAAVIVTTDKVYDNREWVWPYRETEPLGGRDPYSSSKACAELVSAAYRASYAPADGDLAIATARAGNVIGGGDWARDRLVPDLIRAAHAGETLVLRAPRAVRPWQHVLEPLAGYLILAQHLARGRADARDAWNFGPDAADCRTVGAVVEAIAARWGPDLTWRVDAGDHPHEATLLQLDASRARAALGWRPALPLDEALDWLVAGYRAFQDADAAGLRALCDAQIRRYVERAG